MIETPQNGERNEMLALNRKVIARALIGRGIKENDAERALDRCKPEVIMEFADLYSAATPTAPHSLPDLLDFHTVLYSFGIPTDEIIKAMKNFTLEDITGFGERYVELKLDQQQSPYATFSESLEAYMVIQADGKRDAGKILSLMTAHANKYRVPLFEAMKSVYSTTIKTEPPKMPATTAPQTEPPKTSAGAILETYFNAPALGSRHDRADS